MPQLKYEDAQKIVSQLSDYKQTRIYQYLDQRKAEDYKIICIDPENDHEIWITLVDETWRPFLEDC